MKFNNPPTAAAIIAALGYTPVNKAGDTGIGALGATSLALGGATIGSNALAVTGTSLLGGDLLFTDATYDIGKSGVTRPRDGFFSRNLSAASVSATNGSVTSAINLNFSNTGYLQTASRAILSSPADGVWLMQNTATTDFSRLQFGGTTSAFPSLKRSTTILQGRLADDSAFCFVQGKLQTDNAYAAATLVATGSVTMYDSTGTAYRVLCLV